MKTILISIIVALLFSCESLNEIYDGNSYRTAMTVGAQSRPRAREAELAWLGRRHSKGFVVLHRETKHKKGKEYDLVTIRTLGNNSSVKTYYFHIDLYK